MDLNIDVWILGNLWVPMYADALLNLASLDRTIHNFCDKTALRLLKPHRRYEENLYS